MTITITATDSPLTERIIQFLRREKVQYDIQNDDEAHRIHKIRERLRLKYVINGEWSKMTDEERQDASLLEGMLYDDDNGLVELLSDVDAKAFSNEMKSWAK